MSTLRHISLLLWKNYLLQLRHPWVTIFEILIPCIFVGMLAGIRTIVEVKPYDNSTYFPSFDIYHVPNMPNLTTVIGTPTYNIYFAPNDPIHKQIMDGVIDKLMDLKPVLNTSFDIDFKSVGFATEDELVNSYLSKFDFGFLCGVVFDNSTNNTEHFSYKLRFKSSPTHQLGDGAPFRSWFTKTTFPQFSLPGPRQKDYYTGAQPGYYEEGFLAIQHLISMAFLNKTGKITLDSLVNDYEVVGQRFPYPPYIDDGFLVALQFLFPVILMFGFIYTPTNLTKNLVLEKEKRLKESMKMMGLKEWMHWFAWFTKTLVWNTITVAIMTLLLCIKIKDGVGILNKSDPSFIFVFFFLYSLNTIAFSFLISTLFSKANVAGVGSGVIFFFTFMPYFTASQRYLEISLAQKVLTGFLHNTNMAFGAIVIAMWEGNNVGVQWANLNQTATPDDNLTLLTVLLMFIVDTVIYFLLTWYISSVFPGEYGIPLKWYFPFTKTYWCPVGCAGDDNDVGVDNHGFDLKTKDSVDNENAMNSSYYETEPNNLTKGIQIKGLSKTFDGGDNYAVKDLNLNTYSGQITALLGHNGAGKTTTMSMLTGLFPPSKGKAIVNGYDIRKNMDKIRSSLGICPQFDVLYDELTVEEHLRFFCRLKNVTDSEVVEEEITNMIELLALQDKRKSQAMTLSGGMKRKLSVGNALIGGSKIVILDEPTSGMDVSARRFIWDLLLEVKHDRTILLSTHFMEEADVLGDRIAIMANGKLQCCGSPLFLKKKYGAGYHLTISKKNVGSDVGAITRLILMHIPNAKLDTSGGTELAYSLPNEDTSKFEALFADIEERQHELGIDSYGASITTMEEVFLKVGEYAEEGIKAINENKNGFNNTKDHSSLPMDIIDKKANFNRNIGMNLIFQQFYGLIMKKILYGWRNPFLTLSQMLLPLIFTISSILVMRANPKPSDSPALYLNLKNFKSTKVSYFYNDLTQGLAKDYAKLLNPPNIGESVPSQELNLTEVAIKYLDDSSRKDMSEYSLHRPISAIFQNETSNKKTVTALFNNQGYHTPAISLAFVDNAIIKNVLNKSDFILDVINHPMPRTAQEILNSEQYESQSQFQIAQNLMFAMSFLAASFAVLLVRERAIKGKHLQLVCGVKLYIFWTASYIIDFLTYIIPCVLVMLMYVVFKDENLEGGDQQGRLFVLFVVHGLAMLPFVYCLSFMFDIPSTAYVRICLYNVILGIGTFLAVVITELPALKIVETSKVLNVVFSMFLPNFCLGRAVYNLYQNHLGNKLCTGTYEVEIPPMSGHKFNLTLQDVCTHLNVSSPEFSFARMCCKGKCQDDCFPWEQNYFSLDTPGIGQLLLWMCFQAVIYWIIVILIEYNAFRNLKYFLSNLKPNKIDVNRDQNNENIDEDVLDESKRLQFTEFDKLAENNALIIKNLSKNYGSFCAVDNISYGVRKGECFGLLGVNGAGKTTTFKMITGDEPITSGDIYVNGYNVKNDIQQVQRQIGYCPQFDGLLDQLTGKETLTLFSRLRGIQENNIPALIGDISRLLYFDMHIDKQVGKYSGGTKRKLSTAVALLGSPSVSFLDEPTTGVDPVARRCLWDALTKKLYEGSSIVLTSHSMEECEALCNRLIIMVNGRICCIGSPQHLKNKFGKGYTVQIKVSTTEGRDRMGSVTQLARRLSRTLSGQSQKKRRSFDSETVSNIVYNRQTSEMILTQNITDVKDFMSNAFPGSQLKAVHNNLLEYNIIDDKLTWSQIFGRIERAKDRTNIEDYSIGQTTLEQIFLSFARKQRETKD